MSAGRSRPIAPAPLHAQQFEEKSDGFTFLVETVLDAAAVRTYASPTPNEARLAEQGLFDRERVEAGHVAPRVMAFDIEAIGLRDHAWKNRAARTRRPMIALNPPGWIDSFR
ncbi:hypothetical protein CHELA40_20007 [Chelatococcus asaccharovorans]|nr:hypothetical protein CHELA17_10065 [Chelatococcus asaccharovorans]CAH1687139.1 hypothetical protein CHELA40_20007 [Chelatococcus asaccharovorans]